MNDSTLPDTQILALAIDSRPELQEMSDRISRDYGRPPDFPLLSDPGHKVIDRYGLLNPGSPGWPHPATYVIDRNGIVRWKFVEVDYRVRPTNEQVVAALKSLGR